jgi:surface antigen
MSARLGLVAVLVLLCGACIGAPASLADAAPRAPARLVGAAPQPWEPTTADVTRTLRPCPPDAPALTVCWSVTEDTSAWMALPPDSPYPWGQCTYYAGLMRPDLWNERVPGSADPQVSWDAWTWAGHAQTEGLAVDGHPQPGDVMVYSRGAAGNDTGHVAIVDSVGGTDPATGARELTISEMNVEGLDDASRGQGDTTTLELPRSQLVPGMIQFVHHSATVQWQAERNPSLAVGLWGGHLATVSRSAAPGTAVVTASDGSVVKRLRVTPNGVVALGLPTGTYTACVRQPANATWDGAGGCATATWRGRVTATVSLGRPHRSGRRTRSHGRPRR